MDIVVGRGNRRQVVTLPSRMDNATREKIAWNVKQMLFERGIIPSLGGGR